MTPLGHPVGIKGQAHRRFSDPTEAILRYISEETKTKPAKMQRWQRWGRIPFDFCCCLIIILSWCSTWVFALPTTSASTFQTPDRHPRRLLVFWVPTWGRAVVVYRRVRQPPDGEGAAERRLPRL
jgi:hypothetical protein